MRATRSLFPMDIYTHSVSTQVKLWDDNSLDNSPLLVDYISHSLKWNELFSQQVPWTENLQCPAYVIGLEIWNCAKWTNTRSMMCDACSGKMTTRPLFPRGLATVREQISVCSASPLVNSQSSAVTRSFLPTFQYLHNTAVEGPCNIYNMNIVILNYLSHNRLALPFTD